MSKFIIVERGEVYEDNCAVTWSRDVFCEEMNIGVSFSYDIDDGIWKRDVINYFRTPREFFPGDDYDGSYCTVSEVNLTEAAAANFIYIINEVRDEEHRRKVEYAAEMAPRCVTNGVVTMHLPNNITEDFLNEVIKYSKENLPWVESFVVDK